MDPDDIDRSILILDTETTGVDKVNDQVVELAIQYGFEGPDDDGEIVGAPQTVWRFKPTKSVGSASAIHGITDEMLADKQPFKAYAARLYQIIDEAEILVGYNIGFDLDMLGAEFTRCRMPLPDLQSKLIIDAMRLWQRFEPRTLTAAFERFVGGPLKGAHDAGVDVHATGAALLGMLRDFGLSHNSWEEIAKISDPDRSLWLGHTNHVKWERAADGNWIAVLTFGKWKGHRIDDPEARGYLFWVRDKGGFPSHVTTLANAALQLKDRFLAWALERYPPPEAPAANGEGDEAQP